AFLPAAAENSRPLIHTIPARPRPHFRSRRTSRHVNGATGTVSADPAFAGSRCDRHVDTPLETRMCRATPATGLLGQAESYDLGEILGLQARPTDQGTIDAGDIHDVNDILGFHVTTIKYSD
ncbi:MAG: hypothetical protein H6R26_3304, partial [Proteobacteria bacterium]|nr:hypothetical protein [Pseudomonadota bacterium]